MFKCLFLAAGYATRLYPLTENFPKPLLEVKGKAILDWLIEDIDNFYLTDNNSLKTDIEYIVVSNHKFAPHFKKWSETRKNIKVVDDGTCSNETRLGAVKDIWYAVEKLNIKDDLLVVAGDNLLDFSLNTFIKYAIEKKTSCVMRYFEENNEKLKKCGVITTDENGLITNMTEKPQNPESNWVVPPFYFFTVEDVMKISHAIENGCEVDAPGSYITWLCKNSSVHAMEMPGKRYDIGNLESYNNINSNFGKIVI